MDNGNFIKKINRDNFKSFSNTNKIFVPSELNQQIKDVIIKSYSKPKQNNVNNFYNCNVIDNVTTVHTNLYKNKFEEIKNDLKEKDKIILDLKEENKDLKLHIKNLNNLLIKEKLQINKIKFNTIEPQSKSDFKLTKFQIKNISFKNKNIKHKSDINLDKATPLTERKNIAEEINESLDLLSKKDLILEKLNRKIIINPINKNISKAIINKQVSFLTSRSKFDSINQIIYDKNSLITQNFPKKHSSTDRINRSIVNSCILTPVNHCKNNLNIDLKNKLISLKDRTKKILQIYSQQFFSDSH